MVTLLITNDVFFQKIIVHFYLDTCQESGHISISENAIKNFWLSSSIRTSLEGNFTMN